LDRTRRQRRAGLLPREAAEEADLPPVRIPRAAHHSLGVFVSVFGVIAQPSPILARWDLRHQFGAFCGVRQKLRRSWPRTAHGVAQRAPAASVRGNDDVPEVGRLKFLVPTAQDQYTRTILRHPI